MCLNLRKNYDKPYNKSNIRWKFGINFIDGLKSFYRLKTYHRGTWMRAISDYELNSIIPNEEKPFNYVSNWRTKYGFHTFLNKKELRTYSKTAEWNRLDALVFLKLECKNFIASGTFFGTKSETWREMRIIEIYDRNGKSIWKLGRDK